MEVIDLDLQGHFGHFNSECKEIRHVRTITRHRFGLGSPNFDQTCILAYSRFVSKMDVIDLDLPGDSGHFNSEFKEMRHVHTITRHRFGLESPNFHQTCTLGLFQLVLKIGVIDLHFQCDFTISTQ